MANSKCMESPYKKPKRAPASLPQVSRWTLASAVLLLACLTMPRAAINVGDSRALSRLVTPNGDHKNDTFVFQCYNPRAAAIEATIYDLAGAEVAQMRLKTIHLDSSYYYDLEWDPNSGGKKPGGVYLYQIRLEKRVYKGTVVVIR
ncbi:MAG: gliding motility-associated C-terminal domain-containing protein [Elusimicrobia bacterium]|nr:gliding motility-associated C-terminal domain-containing protein [Elusimicrobiota bacterium]